VEEALITMDKRLVCGSNQVKFSNCKLCLYSSGRQITYKGKYLNGVRVGEWIVLDDGQKMYISDMISAGGVYDEQGNKTGKWIELDDNLLV
jgi:hypothetical protein